VRICSLLVTGVMLIGCGNTSDMDSSVNAAADGDQVQTAKTPVQLVSSSENKVVANINGQALTQDELEKDIQFALFELEWAKYDTRRAALAERISREQAGAAQAMDVHVLIEPPIPPRVDLPEQTLQPVIGSQDAPITLSVFCNYQSSHCLRMQPAYQELTQLYQGLIAFRFYELPLRFHRDSFSASLASVCANQQASFSPFHTALWGSNDRLNRETYTITARQLGLDIDQFEACLDKPEISDYVRGNMQLAEQYGFRNVPVTLVNGLYLNGPKDVNTLRYMVDYELERLGISRDTILANQQVELKETNLALRLEGVTLSAEADHGSALIQVLDSQQTDSFRMGQEVLVNVTLSAVYSDYVLLSNNGKLERLSLRTSTADRDSALPDTADAIVDDIERAVIASGNVLDTDELPPAGLEYQYRGVVAPEGQRPLSRSWGTEQLQDQERLEAHFQPTNLEVEGVHIMKLTNIEQSEFYKTLGLQENDVIMRVNGEWLHDQQNTLFSSLETGDELSLIIMRKGLPKHYAYNVSD